MIEYIKGELTELTPALATIEAAGVGYGMNISLNTSGRRLLLAILLQHTEPSCGRSSPAMRCNRVDLPVPFLPKRP